MTDARNVYAHIPKVLGWDIAGPPPVSDRKQWDIYPHEWAYWPAAKHLGSYVQVNLTNWVELIDDCLDGLGNMEGDEGDFAWVPDGRIGERLDAERERWIGLASRGSKYHALLLGADFLHHPVNLDAVFCETLPAHPSELEEDEFIAWMNALAHEKKSSNNCDIARDLVILDTMDEPSFCNRGDALDTYDVCLEQRYQDLSAYSEAENLIGEAMHAGCRIIITEALGSPLGDSGCGQSDLQHLYGLHDSLLNAVDETDAWYYQEGPSLLGYPDREIIRLALPLLRWGNAHRQCREGYIELEKIVKLLDLCGPETWCEFSNSFYPRNIQYSRLPKLESLRVSVLNRIVSQFLHRCRDLGYELPQSTRQVSNSEQAAKSLENLYLNALSIGRRENGPRPPAGSVVTVPMPRDGNVDQSETIENSASSHGVNASRKKRGRKRDPKISKRNQQIRASFKVLYDSIQTKTAVYKILADEFSVSIATIRDVVERPKRTR